MNGNTNTEGGIMKFEKQVTQSCEVTHIECDMAVRYWEDSDVNGVNDADGTLMPLRSGEQWKIRIRLSDGRIENWPQGTTASVHYKVVDQGSYYLIGENGIDVVASIENGYVPSMMCPDENGYGDYVIMDIDENGVIQNWMTDLECFGPSEG